MTQTASLYGGSLYDLAAEEQLSQVILEQMQQNREIFRENLMGVYLHGSAAMGCFQAQKSDLDLLFLVK